MLANMFCNSGDNSVLRVNPSSADPVIVELPKGLAVFKIVDNACCSSSSGVVAPNSGASGKPGSVGAFTSVFPPLKKSVADPILNPPTLVLSHYKYVVIFHFPGCVSRVFRKYHYFFKT